MKVLNLRIRKEEVKNSVDIKITGMEDLLKNLEDLPSKVKRSIEGKVSLSELFNQSFMKKYSSFNSIEELFNFGNLKIKSEKDFEEISEEKLNKVVREKTNFNSWKEMLSAAANEYIKKKIKRI